jgi:hypothetical protein
MKLSVLQKLKSKLRQAKPVNQLPVIYDTENPIWLKNELSREEARNFLMDKEIGVFIVRNSETIKDCFVLSVKVAKFINSNEICHYIVVKNQKRQSYSIRGFDKEFSDLKSLVTHCSFIRDMLPVLLDLNFYRKEIVLYERKMNDFYYFSRSSMVSSNPSTSSIGSLSSQCSID